MAASRVGMGAAQRHPMEVLALPAGLVGRLELGRSELAGGEGNRRGRRGRDGETEPSSACRTVLPQGTLLLR